MEELNNISFKLKIFFKLIYSSVKIDHIEFYKYKMSKVALRTTKSGHMNAKIK